MRFGDVFPRSLRPITGARVAIVVGILVFFAKVGRFVPTISWGDVLYTNSALRHRTWNKCNFMVCLKHPLALLVFCLLCVFVLPFFANLLFILFRNSFGRFYPVALSFLHPFRNALYKMRKVNFAYCIISA